MKNAARLLNDVLGILFVVLLTILIGRGFQARRLPDLKPWHRADLGDVKAGELGDAATLAELLKREDAVFRALKERVLDKVAPEDRGSGNRYSAGGPLDPTRLPVDGNRTFELVPTEIKGGALLVHGLTDSPYSLRAVAAALERLGYYALAPRMPGHGTAPSGLTTAEWQDWMSVVRVAARHVASRSGPGKPFVLVGYSSGGALAVKYAQDVLEGSGLPRPDRIVLLSPMIGVTPFAGFARVASLLHVIPYFERNAWLDLVPEYNPYKYNSFPTNAGLQTWKLTKALNEQTDRLAAAGKLSGLAPVLTFQSLADATVSTSAVVYRLYDKLPANGSELVLFDVNRVNELAPFVRSPEEKLVQDLRARTDLAYRLTAVTNARADSREVVARSGGPGPGRVENVPLGLAWPPGVVSLTHVAIPFPDSDDLYGCLPEPPPTFGLRFGRVVPRGERTVLTVGFDQWMRLTWNPFFSYLEARVSAWAAP